MMPVAHRHGQMYSGAGSNSVGAQVPERSAIKFLPYFCAVPLFELSHCAAYILMDNCSNFVFAAVSQGRRMRLLTMRKFV